MRFVTALAGVTLVLGMRSGAQASRSLLEETTIDPAQRTQFEVAQKDYCAAVVRGGAPSCVVLAPTTFTHYDHYMTLLSFGSFAHYDEGTYTSKGLTPAQAKELADRRNPTIKANDECGIEEMFEQGAALSKENAIVQITDITVHPGYEASLLKELRTARGTAEGITVYRVVAGGSTERFLVMRYLQKFVELDRLETVEALAGGKRVAPSLVWRQGVISSSVTIMREMPELSAGGQ